MTKRIVILVGLLCSVIWCPALSVLAQDHSDEAAIRNIINDEVAAWDNGDAVAYSVHFAAEGTFTNILGAFYKGHDAFVKEHDPYL